MLTVILAMMLAPTSEAETLGRRLAATGAIETLLPAIAAKETEEIIAEHHELSEAERATLRAISGDVMGLMRSHLAEAIGHEYAAALSLEDLRKLVAFAATPAAQRYRAAVPAVTMKGLARVGQADFKGDLAKAFCARTGKLCPH